MHGDTYAMWEQLQENGEVSYREDPEHNLGVGARADHLAFADFCGFHGNVLDVGVGPQKEPTHLQRARDKSAFFVGIDPLAGEQPRNFAFVRGLAEHLPFRDGVFDQVLFVTSLDHMLDPVGALREARRVTKPEGRVFLWMGEKNPARPSPPAAPPGTRRSKRRRGRTTFSTTSG
ncbi:MAG: methyltransferase domain-containing protein [Elusimicrobia bacterium]|nr:methyltransferase domain-containing protein [Elusimicrobiota bacterium]